MCTHTCMYTDVTSHTLHMHAIHMHAIHVHVHANMYVYICVYPNLCMHIDILSTCRWVCPNRGALYTCVVCGLFHFQKDQSHPLEQQMMVADTLQKVKRFNEAVQRVQSGEEEAPPIPLKKKTSKLYSARVCVHVVYMYVCVHVEYACMCTCTHVHIYTYTYIHIHACAYTCTYM